jgi:hypothetical protein
MLARRLKFTVPAVPPPVANRLGDWCVNEFRFGRNRWLIVCNTATLFPYVLSARGVTDEMALIRRVGGGLAEVVTAVGGNPAFNRWVATGLNEVQWAPIPDRAVLSSLSELAMQACYGLADGVATPQELSRWLAQTPMKTIGHNSPDRAFRTLRGSEQGLDS